MLAMGKCVTMAYAKSMFGLRRSGFFAFGLREACAYLSCLMLVFSGYHMCSDGKFSAIVCLGSVFQALSFVLLYMKYSIFLYILNLILAFFENFVAIFLSNNCHKGYASDPLPPMAFHYACFRCTLSYLRCGCIPICGSRTTYP